MGVSSGRFIIGWPGNSELEATAESERCLMANRMRRVMERPREVLRNGKIDVPAEPAFLKLKAVLLDESEGERKPDEEDP
jgi:hypothetical protein